ncbi:DUF4625 domain-containing protein [Zhouia spongiae]|uniref:DUF4625 domain-containing protein n=1 Tax=Zhouia spongiae TaxID=2202721 RepID=A0ABY3YQC7_9FLAO|nr:DUF4625 domain-containing protein [Zhouia spongiae]UNZ00043.1 DUF4625 domain-containing protein [Zhouia spongiae]
MKTYPKLLLMLLSTISLLACSSSDDNEVDKDKPTISVNYAGGFPRSCEILERGQTYTFKAQVADNVALASYSLDIHHNFDHHTHDDQGAQCNLEAIKQAVNPMIFMKNYTIEGGGTSYEINIDLTIPEDIDTGDYHCQYSVTDQTGWQSRTSIDIKIID